MKPLIVCGFSETGKTTFIQRAVEGLKAAGFTVSYIKHASSEPKLSSIDRDTERLFESGADNSIAVSSGFDIVYRRNTDMQKSKGERLKIRTLLTSISSDYVIIEGFKSYDGPIPRIVFGRNREDIEELKNNLTVGYSGRGTEDYGINGLTFLSLSMDKKEIADYIVLNTVPFVADLDCGECGFPTCRDFAVELLAGKKELNDCIPMNDDIKLLVNGNRVALKGFVRSTFRDIIKAYVQNLHGTGEGRIQINIR